MFELVFRTTNKAKFAHLRFVAKQYDVQIKTVGDYGKPYTEPRLEDREELLTESIKDALLRDMKKRKNENFDEEILENMSLEALDGDIDKYNGTPFIIEDTSLRVEVLSTSEHDVPGVDVKYWMQSLSFKELDKKLREKGNNRKVLVRSDVILVMPNQGVIKRFTGEAKGKVSEKDKNLHTNPVYPWLDNKTFNKWFVPDRAMMPISEMTVNESIKYDFRIKAFNKLFEYLKNKGFIQEKNYRKKGERYIQLQLLNQPTYLISGPTCAGKTVLAKHINKTLSYYHIEASDFMYLTYYNLHGTSSDIRIHDFAKAALKETPQIVAEKIIPFLLNMQNVPIVITGFRDPKEVQYFAMNHTKEDPIKVIYIECDQSIRFERNIKRARYDVAPKLSSFKETDAKQFAMGLKDIKKLSNCETISNQKSIFSFYKNFDNNYVDTSSRNINTFKNYYKEILGTLPRLEHLILLTLYENYSDQHYTTNQITEIINNNFKELFKGVREPVSPTNVGRYFNSKFHPFYEIELTDRNSNSYRLSQTGISETKLVLNNLIKR